MKNEIRQGMMRYVDQFLTRKNQYCFNRSWTLDAPMELVWNELMHYEKWPAWCHGLERIEAMKPFFRLGKGNHIRSTWKGLLPYRIDVDAVITDFRPYSFLTFTVGGDLYGDGICQLLTGHDTTTLNFIWNVSPTKLWMKMSSSFARPVFIENHNHIIKHAVKGFEQMITQKSRSLVKIL